MLALAVTVVRLLSVDIGPWRAGGAGGYWIDFPAPKGIAGKHLRLELEQPARIRFNGSELPGGPAREFDLEDLRPTGNRVSCPSNAGTARLLVTPRVFASQASRSAAGLTITIRNTLENTANVSVTVRRIGGGDGPGASATVGPGTSHSVEVRGPLPEGPLEVMVQKEEEAVEGQYQFIAPLDMIFRTGTTR